MKRRMSSKDHSLLPGAQSAVSSGSGGRSGLKAAKGDDQPPPNDEGGGVVDGGGQILRGLCGPPKGNSRALLASLCELSRHAITAGGGEESARLVRQKLEVCRDVVFDFGECQSLGVFDAEIEAKRLILHDVLQYVSHASALDTHAELIIQTVSANIFRPLPPPSPTFISHDEELIVAEAILDPSYLSGWTHLQEIYEILLTLVVSQSVTPKLTKRLVDQTFVLRLLDLFASEDLREREYLKTILHRIYGKIMGLRCFVRQCIENMFICYIEEKSGAYGISELLEILGSIINGFAKPLKADHIKFLRLCMIPLHKINKICLFHQQLSYCMVQYVQKDPTLITAIITGILKFWPIKNTPKQVLFINEIEDLIEVLDLSAVGVVDYNPSYIGDTAGPPGGGIPLIALFQQLAECIASPHFRVSERALFLWNNPKVIKLVNQYKESLYPILIQALYNNTETHWNFTVHSLSFNVSKLLADADPKLYAQCSEEASLNYSDSGDAALPRITAV